MKTTKSETWYACMDMDGLPISLERKKQSFHHKKVTVTWECDELCECCNKKASTHDSEGFPLCKRCMNSLIKSQSKKE